MIYQRTIQSKIEKQLLTSEIVVLTGMRRTGKTTLYRQIFEQIRSSNKAFIDVENPINQKIFEEVDYNNIWANLKPLGINSPQKAYLFLDEIQAKPEIVPAIKYLYDHYQTKFFVTGSSSFYLKNLFPESLAGRKITFELYPLTFQEFLIFKNQVKEFAGSFALKDKKKNEIVFEKTKKYYDEYLEYGGFPEVVLAKQIAQKKEKLNDIFKSYFEKDVRSLASFKDLSVFRDLLLLLLQRIGSKLDISKLAAEVKVSRDTVYSYLSFLQSTYFIFLISPFTKSIDRKVSGAKKVYLCDNGLVNQFAKVSEGNLLENAVFHNLLSSGPICYYQKRGGQEIDFILAEKKIGLEVKANGQPSDLKRLKKIAQVLGLEENYLVTKNYHQEKNIIPALEI